MDSEIILPKYVLDKRLILLCHEFYALVAESELFVNYLPYVCNTNCIPELIDDTCGGLLD